MRRFILSATLLASLILPSSIVYAASPPGVGNPHVISVEGITQIEGRDVFIDILAVVPAGASENEIAIKVLQEQGARPVNHKDLESAAYTTEGWVWPQFFDSSTSNNFVTQYYNPMNDPNGPNGETALTNSQNTWTAVSSSAFEFAWGGQTTRYPSLVRESPGPQRLDGYNDVGWARLGGSILGVTWYTTSPPYETDMALNYLFSWDVASGGYDKETVFLHENGHVVGLGHSADPSAVMYAYYNDIQPTLASDDINGISALYPTPVSPGIIVGTVTDSETGADVIGATASTDTGQSTITGIDGSYTLENVPAGDRTVTVSASGYSSSSQQVSLNSGETRTIDFTLEPIVVTSDFILSVSPVSKSVKPGQTARYTVTLTAVNGYNSPVFLSVSGLPPDMTATFSTNPVTPTSRGATTRLMITTSKQTPSDTYNLTVQGEGEGLTQYFDVTLIVK